ncbi:MAG: hypothetical protein NTX25_13475, partial [Proteobacteria bacterium]|nr:hypothetical protein [Pseudomonadota bacterium]
SFAEFLPAPLHRQTRLERERLPQLELPAILSEKPLVCLHAFAGRMSRCAPIGILKSLAEDLKQRGYLVLWLGTVQELTQLRRDDPSLLPEHCVDAWAKDLLSLSWLISKAKLFIGHDSGPLHVAGALGIPVLAFYLPGEPARTYPQGRASAVMVVRDKASLLTKAAAEEALQSLLAVLERGSEVPQSLIRL